MSGRPLRYGTGEVLGNHATRIRALERAVGASGTDAYPINESASILSPGDDGYSDHWGSPKGTVDNLCLYNGYAAADGTQNAFLTWRFMLGPRYSVHEFVYLIRTGPDYGIAEVFLASIPEDDPGSSFVVPTNILQDISTLNFVSVFSWDAYSASLTRNVMNQTNGVRPMGADGAPLTAAPFDGGEGHFHLDGGAGPYAMMVKISTKSGSSSGYKFDLQDLHRKRVDWAFG